MIESIFSPILFPWDSSACWSGLGHSLSVLTLSFCCVCVCVFLWLCVAEVRGGLMVGKVRRSVLLLVVEEDREKGGMSPKRGCS